MATGAWQASARGVAKSRTRLKQLSVAQQMHNKIQKGYKPIASSEVPGAKAEYCA